MKTKLLFSIVLCAIVLCSNVYGSKNFTFKKGKVKVNSEVTSKKSNRTLNQEFISIPANDLISFGRNENLLKASRVESATVTSLFNRPLGTYIPSLIGNEDPAYLGYSYTYPGYFGSAYSIPWTFRNLSTNATSYSWNWGDSIKYSTETNVAIKDDANNFLSNGSYYAPLLNAINGTDTVPYEMSYGTADYPLLDASSGTQYVGVPDYYANTAQANTNGNSIYYVGASGGTALNGTGYGYFWGTCLRAADGTNGTKVSSLVNIYEKPMSPMVIKDICLMGLSVDGNAPVPVDKFLTLSVIKLDATGNFTTDTLASAKISGTDVIVDEYKNCYFPFTFTKIDPLTGREAPMTLVVNDAFAIVLSGLEQDGMDFGMLSDYKNLIEGSSYFTKVDKLTGVSDGNLYKSSTNKMNMYFMMNSYFNFLYADPASKTLTAPAAGGSAVDATNSPGAVIYSFFNVVDTVTLDNQVWIDETTLPSWLTVTYDDSYFTDYNALVYDFKAEALPAGASDRSADVVFNSYGAQTTITIKQNSATGLGNIKDRNVSVCVISDNFDLTYSNDFNTALLYNTSGQLIADYKLPETGKYNIPTNNLSKGIYIVRFVGTKTETVKVVR